MSTIIIRLRDMTNGEIKYYKVNKSSKMLRIFDGHAFAERLRLQASSLSFFFNGERIDPTQTPKMLKMAAFDQIDCELQRTYKIRLRSLPFKLVKKRKSVGVGKPKKRRLVEDAAGELVGVEFGTRAKTMPTKNTFVAKDDPFLKLLPPKIAKRNSSREAQQADPLVLLLNNADLWANGIFPFLGPGHFLYVALVSRRFKELYLAFFDRIQEPPMENLPMYYQMILGRPFFGRLNPVAAIATSTFHSAAFSSVACAQFWDEITKVHKHRLRDEWVCCIVAKHGNLEVLKWARQQDFEWDKRTCSEAARNGHLDVLQYAHERDCPWDTSTCCYAAENGHLKVLEYAHDKGCEWDARTCAVAAENGHLEVLEYARDHGCEWDSSTCEGAAENGHLEILKWAREKSCGWSVFTSAWAAKNGHLEVLRYAHQNGCPWNEWTPFWAKERGHDEVLEYAVEHGCPGTP